MIMSRSAASTLFYPPYFRAPPRQECSTLLGAHSLSALPGAPLELHLTRGPRLPRRDHLYWTHDV